MLTPERLEELRRAAEAATQRTWAVYDPHGRGEEYLIVTGTGERIVLAVINEWARTIDTLNTAQADAQHIATFDPPTVLAMLDEIERLRRELAYVKENAEFLRSSVGECHLMISRNSSEFQTQGKQWRLSDLPARLQRIMRERETLAEALREIERHVHGHLGWYSRICPDGAHYQACTRPAEIATHALLDGEGGA